MRSDDARRLLHVVGHDDDRVVALQLGHEIFDPTGRDRVQRRARLVHQDDVRLDRERAGDAEPLLLAAGERERALLQLVLHLVPERGLGQRVLDDLVQTAPLPVHPRAERDVVVDRLRERVRLLEHHADPPPDLDRVDLRTVEVDAVVQQLAVHGRAGDEVVHPVQAAQERALAATGGTDERGDLPGADRQLDLFDRLRRRA